MDKKSIDEYREKYLDHLSELSDNQLYDLARQVFDCFADHNLYRNYHEDTPAWGHAWWIIHFMRGLYKIEIEQDMRNGQTEKLDEFLESARAVYENHKDMHGDANERIKYFRLTYDQPSKYGERYVKSCAYRVGGGQFPCSPKKIATCRENGKRGGRPRSANPSPDALRMRKKQAEETEETEKKPTVGFFEEAKEPLQNIPPSIKGVPAEAGGGFFVDNPPNLGNI